jgi:peptidoglycan-associated lipoprotein
MKKYNTQLLSLLACITLATSVSGCKKNRSSSQWDQTPVASRFATTSTLWSKDQDLADSEFVSLKDEDLAVQYTDGAVAQPAYSPGESGSGLPSFEFFVAPIGDLAAIFKTVYFATDSYVVRDCCTKAIAGIGAYLKDHPNTYTVVGGFCDERGAEAYNLSLGAKRANTVRQQLIKQGAHPDQIHTISYGKEQPLDIRHCQEAWTKNRRAEFKIYQK